MINDTHPNTITTSFVPTLAYKTTHRDGGGGGGGGGDCPTTVEIVIFLVDFNK